MLNWICNYTPAGIAIIEAYKSSCLALPVSGIVTSNKPTQSHPVSETAHSFLIQLFTEHQPVSDI